MMEANNLVWEVVTKTHPQEKEVQEGKVIEEILQRARKRREVTGKGEREYRVPEKSRER